MILSYKQKYPWGAPTYFDIKIKNAIFNYPGASITRYNNKGEKLPDLWIENRKIHSIRDDMHNRWKPGMIIQHAYGVRTPNYRCFVEGQCMSTQTLEIKWVHWRNAVTSPREIKEFESLPNQENLIVFQLFVDGRQLNGAEINDIARNDGFDSTEDFFRWFCKPGTKKIIHFTDFKY